MFADDLAGKNVLITGASRGIGAAAARAFGAAHARVAVHYRGHRSGAEAVAGDIRAAGGEAVLVPGDLATPAGPAQVVEEAARALGGLDILINNAGDLFARHPLTETPDDMIEKIYALNIRSVVLACRAAIPWLKKSRAASIINVASVAARSGGGGGSILYAGSKAFVATFSRGLAKELATVGIRVNVVSPGVIITDLQDRTTPPDMLQAAVAATPMRRAGQPDECSGAFLYLASPASSGFVTGQTIEVNGGILMP